MLQIAVLPDAAPDLSGVQAVLFTSANGVRAYTALTSTGDLPVFAVGDRTAAAAREAGFSHVESAGGDVTSLVRLVTQRLVPTDGVLLHPAGTAVAGDLAGQLGTAGFVVRRAMIYEAHEASGFTGEVRTALLDAEIDIVLFYSPRTAATFVALAQASGLEGACERLETLCLSAAVAEAADPIMWRRVMVAPEPTQGALLATLDKRLGIE